MKLAELVRQERQRRGWSKADLAREADVSRSVITNMESGKRLGRADTVAKICQVLGIDPAEAQAVLSSETDSDEARDLQLTDLSKVPPNDRAKLRRAIIELVRSFEEDEPGEATG